MQRMSALAFNPLKAARAFKEAGADEKLAEAVAGAIGDAADTVERKLATKADLDALEQRTKTALFRTLWLQTGAIIAAVTAVTKLLP